MKINSPAKAAGVSNYFCASSLSFSLGSFFQITFHADMEIYFAPPDLACNYCTRALRETRVRATGLFLDFSAHKSGALFAA
jgi:hypothetical protein